LFLHFFKSTLKNRVWYIIRLTVVYILFHSISAIGIAPTGYDVTTDKTYIINDKEAKIVEIIFKEYITGNGYGIIAQCLNEAGRWTKLERLYSKSSIRDIL